MQRKMKYILSAVGAVIVATIAALLLTHGTFRLGNVTSPPSVFDYLQVTQALGFGPLGGANNVNVMGVKANIAAANLVPCSLQNPFNATSTVVSAVFNVTTATSSAGQLVFATSTSATATTTALSKYTLGGGELASIAFSLSTSTGQQAVVAPSGYLNIGTDTGSAVGYPYTWGGTCSAVFMQDN